MEAALLPLLPKMLGNITFQVYPHQCKDEMLSRLPERLRGYSFWLPETWRIVVIVDRDGDDCFELKKSLEKFAKNVSLPTRTSSGSKKYSVLNRLAIEELEAWFFGDWRAVCTAYPRTNRKIPYQSKYRDPDSIPGGTWEAFERVLKRAGYFRTGLRKIEVARSVSEHMVPMDNRSHSFQQLRKALMEMLPE